jgi:hypothetical protein
MSESGSSGLIKIYWLSSFNQNANILFLFRLRFIFLKILSILKRPDSNNYAFFVTSLNFLKLAH